VNDQEIFLRGKVGSAVANDGTRPENGRNSEKILRQNLCYHYRGR
jgi:hypothetical protein